MNPENIVSKENDLTKLESVSPFWRIKYRPKTFQEIGPYYRTIEKQIRGFIDQKNFPHLMLVGPNGAGKTIIAEIIAREILKNEFDLNYKILFATDPISKTERDQSSREGRISTNRLGSSAGKTITYRPFIQVKVRPFVSTQKFGDSPFKILSIKDFHKLDAEQQAFRRIMERYSSNCRMILITDKISGIIDPIISRCQLLMVPYIPEHLFNKYIKEICDLEKLPIQLDIINYIRTICQYNLGKALDLIQLTQLRFNFINLENLTQMRQEMDSKIITTLFTQTISENFTSIRKTLREIFTNYNLSKDEILLELSHVVLNLPLEQNLRAFYLDLIAKADYNSLDSNDDEIQLNALLSQMSNVGKLVK